MSLVTLAIVFFVLTIYISNNRDQVTHCFKCGDAAETHPEFPKCPRGPSRRLRRTLMR